MMKGLIVFLLGVLTAVIFSSVANAQDYIPQESDQILVVRDGKVIGKMSRANYKVVKIDDNSNMVPVRASLLTSYMKAKKYQQSHWSGILQMGMGPNGMSIDNTNNQWQVSERQRPMIGGTLCYTKTKTGLCGSAYSNQTWLIGIKQDFNLR